MAFTAGEVVFEQRDVEIRSGASSFHLRTLPAEGRLDMQVALTNEVLPALDAGGPRVGHDPRVRHRHRSR